ncbi:hypothetical protein [Pseudoduganella chitinolytica]|uniref:Uncharacterized protein n=1 Tax=Pseudoduganella chitinolytica TaxID=34070 RepID=A0ABY8B8G0_9BURK|nr:hypothetical protein [Pseudoduganella chitinolytica]WEF32217.1 hypothetical protein PX653_22795 [Pseudoduganella chitinolytica]
MSTRPINQFNQVPATAPPPQGRPVTGVPPRPAPQQASVSMLPRAAIDSESGVRDGVSFQSRSLDRRHRATPRVAPQAQRQGNRKAAPDNERKPGRAALRSTGDDPAVHLEAVEQTLDMLRDDSGRRGREEVKAILTEQHEPMEQWRVLRDALAGVDEQNLSNYKKKVLREAIGEMMADVVDRDSGVRKALQESDVSGSLEAAVEGSAPKSARELRFLITDKGSIDKPLTPLTTLKAVIRHLGEDNCEKAIDTLCAQMLSGL